MEAGTEVHKATWQYWIPPQHGGGLRDEHVAAPESAASATWQLRSLARSVRMLSGSSKIRVNSLECNLFVQSCQTSLIMKPINSLEFGFLG
jgi:hypothetical protein